MRLIIYTLLLVSAVLTSRLTSQEIPIVQSSEELFTNLEKLRTQYPSWRSKFDPPNEWSRTQTIEYQKDVNGWIEWVWKSRTHDSNPPYVDLIKGVKIWHFVLPETVYEQYMTNSLPPIEQSFYDGIKEFMDLYFSNWKFVKNTKFIGDTIPKSFCDLGILQFFITDDDLNEYAFFDSGELIRNGNIEFKRINLRIRLFPTKHEFLLESMGRPIQIPKNLTPSDLKWMFFSMFAETVGFVKIPYDKNFRRKLDVNMSDWTEWEILKHIENTKTNELEGIYYRVAAMDPYQYLFKPERVGVVKNEDEERYNFIYLGGALNADDWQEGEIVAWRYDSENTAKTLHWSNIFKVWDQLDRLTPNRYSPIIKQFTDTSGNFYFEIHTSKGELVARYKKVKI